MVKTLNYEKGNQKVSFLKLNIYEPLCETINITDHILFKGQSVDAESNLEEINICENETLLVLGTSSSPEKIIATDWLRCKHYSTSTQFRMYSSRYDAIGFKARGNTKICGFMWSNADNRNQDFKILVSWCLDNEPFCED